MSGDVLKKPSLALSTCEYIPVQIHLKLIPCIIAPWLWYGCPAFFAIVGRDKDETPKVIQSCEDLI